MKKFLKVFEKRRTEMKGKSDQKNGVGDRKIREARI